MNDFGDLTRVTVDLNKKIAEKLKNNAEFILNKIELDSQNASNSLLNKKRKPDEVEEKKEEKDFNHNRKTNNSNFSNQKDSFKIELSLREEDEVEKVIKEKKLVQNNFELNEFNKTTQAENELRSLTSKWNLKDENKNEFVSTEKIVMILKDKQSFLEKNKKNTSQSKGSIINLEEKIPQSEIKQVEIIEEKLQIVSPSDSESDLDSEIEIPDIF